MSELAALVTPGPFKARKQDPERMLGEFQNYIRSVKNMLVVTVQEDATAKVKKAILQAVGGRTWCLCMSMRGTWRTRIRSTRR